MPWKDFGLIFRVDRLAPWCRSHGYVPTATALGDRIRVFFAGLDEQKVGRIGFIDVKSDDPSAVVGFSKEPVLDVGATGAFDEHGVTPMAACRTVSGALRLYFAGWQRTENARYLLFNGIATSNDDGLTFERSSNVPAFERSDRHYLIRTGFVVRDGATWKSWAAQSDGLVIQAGKVLPSYSLAYMESIDGIHWPETGDVCFPANAIDVIGYGRSAVWRDQELWQGLFSVRHRESGYTIQHGVSKDGRAWSVDAKSSLSFTPEMTGDGQKETMFPSVIECGDRLIMFYNGDVFGHEGIRLAVYSA